MRFQTLDQSGKNQMPSPYARQMGASIANLLRLFSDRVPDRESNARVLELAVALERWSEGHALFDVVRSRYLAATSTNNARKSISMDSRNLVCRPFTMSRILMIRLTQYRRIGLSPEQFNWHVLSEFPLKVSWQQ